MSKEEQQAPNPDHPIAAIPLDLLAKHDGLTLVNMMIKGELPRPPLSSLLNFWLSDAGDGWVEFRGNPSEKFYNPAGTVHGGWMGSIMDSALGCSVWTKVKAGSAYTTAEFKVNFIRPVTSTTGQVICHSKVIHMGRKLAISEASLKDLDGKLLAHGTETCAIFPMG